METGSGAGTAGRAGGDLQPGVTTETASHGFACSQRFPAGRCCTRCRPRSPAARTASAFASSRAFSASSRALPPSPPPSPLPAIPSSRPGRAWREPLTRNAWSSRSRTCWNHRATAAAELFFAEPKPGRLRALPGSGAGCPVARFGRPFGGGAPARHQRPARRPALRLPCGAGPPNGPGPAGFPPSLPASPPPPCPAPPPRRRKRRYQAAVTARRHQYALAGFL